MIPFNDLKPLVAKHRAEIDAAIARVLDRGWFILGPEVEAFETEFATFHGAGLHAIAVANGTDAIELALRAAGIGPGDEVITTPLTAVPTVCAIERAGAKPVFADIDPVTCNLDPEAFRAAITPRTRAILVAHLFGSRLDLRDIAAMARHRGIALWEDVAQGFAADGFPGDSQADISFFSFGMIKAQTAIGGAILRFRDPELAERCRTLHAQWPEQSTIGFRKKLFRAATLQLMSNRTLFTAISMATSGTGLDLDAWLSRSTRGFDQTAFFEQLRKRPCGTLVELLHRRLTRINRLWLARKTQLAEDYWRLLPPHVLLGREAVFPTRWVLPIVSSDPQRLQSRLTKQGFDATRRASQLRVVPVAGAFPEWTVPRAAEWVSQLVYLPLHPALRPRHINAIADTVNELEAQRSTSED